MIDQLPKSLLESVQQIVEKETEYQKFFKGALDKFGVTSPKELSGDKEKEFYNYVDSNWKGKNESVEEEVELDESQQTEQLSRKSRVFPQRMKKDAEAFAKKMDGEIVTRGPNIYVQYDVDPYKSTKKEEVELEENAKTFKSLEDWVMAVVNAGGTISKRANNLVASGLGRNQSATFELKKGRGSMLESNETE